MTCRRALLVLGTILGLAVALPAAAQNKISVGFPPASDFGPLFAAVDKGFFQKRGLDVTPTRIPLVSNIAPSIISGSLQIGMATGPILLQAAEGGLDLVAIGGAARFLKSNPIVSLVAGTGVKVAGAGGLRGKKVGVPGLNSTLHVLFQKWLLDNKVPLAQVTMIEAPFPQMKDLLKGGTLDAVVVIEPFRGRILTEGAGVRVADFTGEVHPDILAAFWVAPREWVQKNPQALRAFREGYAEGIAYCKQNPEDAKALQVKYLGVSSPVVPSYTTEVRPVDLELFVKITRELGMLRQPVDVNKLIAK